MAFLSSSIAVLPEDSPESLVPSEVGVDLGPLPSSSSSLIGSSIFSSADTFLLNCGSRLLLFDFFDVSVSQFMLDSVGRFDSIEPCKHVSPDEALRACE